MKQLRTLQPTMHFQSIALSTFAAQAFAKLEPNFTSNAGVEIYNLSSFFNTTGPWSLMSQAGDYLYIAGTSQILRRHAGLHRC